MFVTPGLENLFIILKVRLILQRDLYSRKYGKFNVIFGQNLIRKDIFLINTFLAPFLTLSTFFCVFTEGIGLFWSYPTFSPVRVTMSRGPYMKRPVTAWAPSSVNTASFTRWLAVTFLTEDDRRSYLSCGSERRLNITGQYVTSHPYFDVRSLTKPLFPRFGGSEFRHFFTVQLQNAGVFMSHHLHQSRSDNGQL